MYRIIPEKYCFLSGSALKLLAIIIMFIDHIGYAILEKGILYGSGSFSMHLSPEQFEFFYILDRVCRTIGRVAFPIFCFMLVEGFVHTSNKAKYLLRLCAFTIISEIPFDLAFSGTLFFGNYQNVFFTLAIGLSVIWLWEVLDGKIYFQVPVLAFGMGLAYLLKTDYSYRGIILIFVLYLFRHYKVLQTVAGCISLYWEAPAMFAFIPLNFYNGKKGFSMKYFFYIFYPAHLLILYFVRILFLS